MPRPRQSQLSSELSQRTCNPHRKLDLKALAKIAKFNRPSTPLIPHINNFNILCKITKYSPTLNQCSLAINNNSVTHACHMHNSIFPRLRTLKQLMQSYRLNLFHCHNSHHIHFPSATTVKYGKRAIL